MSLITTIIGKPAKACRKCQSTDHWVNKIGGIICCRCSPAGRNESSGNLTIIDGKWRELGDSWTPPEPAIVEPAQKTEQKTVQVLPDFMRPVDGSLSARELDIFLSDDVWESKDEFIVFKRKTQCGRRPISIASQVITKKLPLPNVGSRIVIQHAIATLNGPIVAGSSLTISAASYDGCGNPVVSFSQNQREIVCGVSWPL